MDIVSRLDITQIFCDVDDFCQQWQQHCSTQKQLPSTLKQKNSKSRMSLSEIMTIVIAFHGSGFRTFKDFYTRYIMIYGRKAFPGVG